MKLQMLEEKILSDKIKGLSDEEIGNKYKVNLKFIEKVILKNTGINISNPSIKKNKNIKLSPDNFILEENTVWSFKSRGNWATHNGNYRGNWSPYIPRNIILKYSKENDIVLDYFCGSGTTGVECKLLNRNFIGIDINDNAIQLARQNINFEYLFSNSNIEFKVGDARNLDFIKDESIDLICAHPPYSNIIQYSLNKSDDLSYLEVDKFLDEIKKVAIESFRVLKKDRFCSILIGDMRKNKNVIPLGFWTIQKYIEAGFKIKELIIKRQHNCKTTGFWYKNSIKYNFLLLAHEYLIIFEKTDREIDLSITEFNNENIFKDLDFINKKDIYLEATTVWIFNESNYLQNTIYNLIKRYSENFSIYNKSYKENSDLILYLFDNNFENFCKNIIKMKKGSIIAILCEDKRTKNNMIFSQELFLEKILRENKLINLKEIVIIVLENSDKDQKEYNSHDKEKLKENLNINHKYLLIYKRF